MSDAYILRENLISAIVLAIAASNPQSCFAAGLRDVLAALLEGKNVEIR